MSMRFKLKLGGVCSRFACTSIKAVVIYPIQFLLTQQLQIFEQQQQKKS
jgi:hypothetical protein